jgi:hypothetical protein
MPLKLNIPEVAASCPPLRVGGMGVRGRAARLRQAREHEAEVRNREARLQVTFICYALLLGFWFQFVTGILYDIPALHTLSGGLWYAPSYEFYLKAPGCFPFSIAGNFVFYSAFGSALAAFFGCMFTRGVVGKWRLRFAVALFITITLGWSIAAYRAEEAAWTVGIDQRIDKARQMWRRAAEMNEAEMWLRSSRLEVEQLEKIRKTREWVPREERW